MALSRFTSFDDDPFFEGHRERMGAFAGFPDVSQLFGFPDGPANGRRQAALPSSDRRNDQVARRSDARRDRDDFLDPFRGNFFQDVTSHMGNMMQSMNTMRDRMMNMAMDSSTGSPDGHSYMQSSVYSYKNTGEGKPQVYEAHHSRRTAPGGVNEEKKALRDTERNLEKMSVGRHIRDRGHVMQRTRRTDTNEVHDNRNVIGMDESEIDGFMRDWHAATGSYNRAGGRSRAVENRREQRPHRKAIEGSKNAKL